MSTDGTRTRRTNARASFSTTDPWFATSQVDRKQDGAASDPPKDAAMFIVHAKRLGTIRSACGQDTTTWHKYWTSFHLFSWEQACRSCIAEISEQQPRRPGSSAVS